MTYKNFAFLYDELMSDAPYDKWVQFTKKILNKRQLNKIIDLGCGTGEITVRLAKEYDKVFGVDQSAEMLSIAQQKAADKQVNITWIKQDIRKLSGFKNINVFISYCDVINYITEENDIKKLFSNIYDSLSPDGLFIFDIHSIEHVKHHLVDQTFTYTDQSIAYIWHCSSGKEEGEMYHDMTFFYKTEDDSHYYKRFEEIHHQRTFHVNKYKQYLHEAQFSKIDLYSDFSLQNNFLESKSERIFIVAHK